MSIRNKISLMRLRTSKNNRHGISSRLKSVSLCLGILICGVVLVYATILKTNNRDKRSQAELTGSISPSPTPVPPSANTGMNTSASEQVGKQADQTSGKDVLRAVARRLPGRATTSSVASAGKSFEFQSKFVAVIPESGKSKSVSETPAETTVQKTAERSLATFSNDATPRWIPPAKRQGIPGTAAEPNKPKATDHPASDPTAPGLPDPGLEKDKTTGSSPTNVSAEKQRSGETERREIKEALKNEHEAELKKLGPEFKGIAEPKTSITGKTDSSGAVAKPNALQQLPEPLKAGISKPDLVYPAQFFGDVRLLPPDVTVGNKILARPELERPEIEELKPLPGSEKGGEAQPAAPAAPLAPMPAPSQSFHGLNFSNGSGWPPDTVGDVGPNHYVQAVNTSVGIYSKTGTQLAVFTFNTLWSGAGTGTPCDSAHKGDPTVIYSRRNNRFIVADFAWTNTQSGPYYECISVSKTSNPVSGGWWLFAYRADDAAHPFLPDYPKMGIWPDGLYMSANMFDCLNPSCSSATYEEARAYAFNLTDLVTGAPLRSVVADTNSSEVFSLLPSNYRGTPPPAGRENLFVSQSDNFFAFEVWKFHVDYAGAGTTFTGPTLVPTSTYSLAGDTVPSPGNPLDSLNQRLMMQNQYRNISGVESLWVNHTTGAAAAATPVGIQWMQINATGGTILTTPVQQQIYNNSADGLSRWAGSLAVDNQGNMALGFSASSISQNPDIRYVGRLATDPLGTLPQTEVSIINPPVTLGTQSGTCGGSICTRWGDYSSMSVDPSDECTFWYTQEYFETTGVSWTTRIGSFKFPSCISASQGGAGNNTIGVYDPASQTFYLRNSNTIGNADIVVPYGPPGATPVVGDWNGDGTTTIGIYDPPSQTFYLRNTNSVGFADIVVRYGPPGAIPLVGDWDGDGITTIGVYDPGSRTFYLRNSNSPGFADIVIQYGPPGAVPLAGDWNGDGVTTIGVYDPASQTFYLRNSNTPGFADLTIAYGPPNAIPVVGDWDRNGTVTIGVYDPGSRTFYLRNSNSIGFADITIAYGPSAVKPLAGDWDGQ